MNEFDADLLRPHEERIQAYIEREHPKVRIASPCKLAVKLRDGRYRTQSFIGEEEFEVTAIYFSDKTGQALFVARPVHKPAPATDRPRWTFVEFNLHQARESAIGFESLLEGALDIRFDEIAERRAEEKRAERVAHNESYQPAYGSW